MNPQSAFQAVTFDFGGVLTCPMDGTAIAFAAKIGLPKSAYRDTVAFNLADRALYGPARTRKHHPQAPVSTFPAWAQTIVGPG
ncbi:hypothetical protein ACFXPT_35125 [Streptomyces goshikiensis]|uniref:hypothetical protein n=1 Tax=Streptomyces goshikiensis TaxID=1942 RepID=UPI0036B35221